MIFHYAQHRSCGVAWDAVSQEPWVVDSQTAESDRLNEFSLLLRPCTYSSAGQPGAWDWWKVVVQPKECVVWPCLWTGSTATELAQLSSRFQCRNDCWRKTWRPLILAAKGHMTLSCRASDSISGPCIAEAVGCCMNPFPAYVSSFIQPLLCCWERFWFVLNLM